MYRLRGYRAGDGSVPGGWALRRVQELGRPLQRKIDPLFVVRLMEDGSFPRGVFSPAGELFHPGRAGDTKTLQVVVQGGSGNPQ